MTTTDRYTDETTIPDFVLDEFRALTTTDDNGVTTVGCPCGGTPNALVVDGVAFFPLGSHVPPDVALPVLRALHLIDEEKLAEQMAIMSIIHAAEALSELLQGTDTGDTGFGNPFGGSSGFLRG